MLKRLYLAIIALFSITAGAQVCDVTYTVDIDNGGRNVTMTTAILYALPIVDVLDNTKNAMKTVDMASKVQDKGGSYTVELGEVRSCDGKAPERVPASSIMVKGVTLDGLNKITRVGLSVGDQITKRYEDRQKSGAKEGWAHEKAKPVKRDDLGNKIKS